MRVQSPLLNQLDTEEPQNLMLPKEINSKHNPVWPYELYYMLFFGNEKSE